MLNLLLSCSQYICSSDDRKEKTSVCVIGAGIAGLGAAQLLKKAESFEVKVIEARDRTGGRVQCVPFGTNSEGTIVCDLGASWIHGQGPGAYELKTWVGQLNPIYELAIKHDIKTVKNWDGDREPSQQELYWHRGGKVPYQIFETLASMENYLEDLQEKNDPLLEGRSVREVLAPKYLPENASKDDLELFEFLLSYRWGQDYGADVEKYSAKYQEIDTIFEGSEDLVPKGMCQIVQVLEKDLDIQLSRIVKTIDYSNQGQVGISFKDGSQLETFDKVIVTVPLGVLKSRDIDFKPELP